MDKKWVSGLLISIVAGLAVWFFTQSEYSPFLGPNVELTDLNMPERIAAGEAFQVSFQASNKRNKVERDCQGFVMILGRKDGDSSTSNPEGATATARRGVADCRTQNPKFYLGGLSGSSIQILVDCEVRRAGNFRMIYGVNCRSGERSKWQLDHQTYIEVEEP